MCGLILALSKNNKPAGQYAFELYKKQETRGRDGFGYLAIKDGQIVSVERSKTEEEIRPKLMKEVAELIILHHRFPTSTDNTIGTTHPMFVSNDELEYDYYFSHNGVITNASVLKEQHNKLGYDYLTEHKVMEVAEYMYGQDPEYLSEPKIKFNDSESLAIELARNIEGLNKTIDTMGSAAFIGVSVYKGTNEVHRVYFGKNMGRELNYFKNKKWFCVTSTTGEDLDDMKLHVLNLENRDMELLDLKIDLATPVVKPVMGYGARLPSYSDFNKLENRFYTWQEVRDSGFPFTVFTVSYENNVIKYMPNKFVIEKQETLNLPPLKEDEEINAINELAIEESERELKATEMLEELATEYALIMKRMDTLDERLNNRELSEYYCIKKHSELEIKADELEERMSSLGLSSEVVEETVDLAIQMEDYNDSFNYIK